MSWYKILKHFGIILKDVFWFMDSNERYKRSVQRYLRHNCNLAIIMVNNGWFHYFSKDIKDQRKIMKQIYSYVDNNWYWESDKDNYDKVEYWENIDTALLKDGIDCETMSTIVYSMARVHKVNPLHLYFVIGTVKGILGSPNHAWVEWYDEDKNEWYIIDNAYYPLQQSNPFRKASDKRYISREYKTTFV